jgi:3-oxoacyl-[acyl-carrier-protein] synthase-1
MLAALRDANLQPEEIAWLNLHGTGTRLNDEMESHAVHAVFGDRVLASSSKALTGHTLGAAGAMEAALCWLLLADDDDRKVVPHVYDGEFDPACSSITLCATADAAVPVNYAMSNSFAFGGSNVSLILARVRDV